MSKASNLLFPYSVRTNSKGELYVTDTFNHRIRKLEKDRLVGVTGGSDGSSLRFPADMAFTETNDLVISDSDHDQLVVLKSRTGQLSKLKEISIQSGKPEPFGSPTQLDVFAGSVYLADTLKNRILIINLDSKSAKSIEVHKPLGIAVNRKTGNITFTQRGSNSVFVCKNGNIEPLAGSSLFGFTDGQGTAASFFEPYGLSSKEDGSILVADAGNHSIREVSLDGYVTTLAGNRTKGFADGTEALFHYPMGVTSGPDGVVFVADTYNHKIRKIFPNLEVETVA